MFEDLTDTGSIVMLGMLFALGFGLMRFTVNALSRKANAQHNAHTASGEPRDAQEDAKDHNFHHERHTRQERADEARSEGWSLPWYEVLGITPNASVSEIRTAYKRKMSQYHPDKVAGLGPEFNKIAEQKAKEINLAYEQAMAGRG